MTKLGAGLTRAYHYCYLAPLEVPSPDQREYVRGMGSRHAAKAAV